MGWIRNDKSVLFIQHHFFELFGFDTDQQEWASILCFTVESEKLGIYILVNSDMVWAKAEEIKL